MSPSTPFSRTAPGYLGCYADSGRPLTSVLGDSSLALDHMSVTACREHCRATGARLAGLKNGQECYCARSDGALVPGSRQSDRQCQEPCAGNPDQICGGPRARVRSQNGPDRLSVYDREFFAFEYETYIRPNKVAPN